MMSYNNSDVVQCLRQYEMFANSLYLIKDAVQREMIIKQLTKLEEKIIDLTNEEYEEEYYALLNKECSFFDEEKKRLSMLIDLINQRLSYVEKRCNNHYELTGETINAKTVLGSLELDELENRVRIIDTYNKNVKLEKELNEEVKSLENKISLASEKMDINKSLNNELETNFKKTLGNAFESLHLYDLLDMESDIEYAYYETEKSLTMAGINLETAKTSPINILNDCQEMYNEVSNDYVNFKDKMMTIRLIKTYDSEVFDYDSLLNKRKEINEILKYIKNQELLDMIKDTIEKQYNTIIMEGQDINTYHDLVLEKQRKEEAINEINNENNSEEFQTVLKELIENERKKQERILEEQRRVEEIERKKRLEIERKRQEEILRRQRIIEETRKKEMEERTKKMLEEQQKSILQTKKKENVVSFETIKDSSLEDEIKEEKNDKKEEFNLEEISNKYKLDLNEEEKQPLQFEDKYDDEEENKNNIEKDLFAEFNNQSVPFEEPSTLPDDIPVMDREVLDDKIDLSKHMANTEPNDNKFPDMSLDDYMRNFDENKVHADDNFFGDAFPTIPM